MTQFFHYYDPSGAFDVDLGNQTARLGDYGGFSSQAEAGGIGNSTFIMDDPDGTLGHSSDGILGLKGFYVLESDCATVGADGVNGTHLYHGFFRERTYRRGDTARSSLITSVARQVTATLEDINASMAFRILTTAAANRPAETDVARVQWLLALPDYLFNATNDAGFVDTSGPVNMDANDYTGQTAADILHDCALASGKNYFILWWEATGHPTLWYADSNTSTQYTSALSISNVLTDVNNTTIFAPMPDAELRRDPTRTYAGVYLAFAAGHSYKTNAATGTTYAWRDGSAPTANVKTQAKADAEATRLVNDAANEEDRISCRVQLPSSLATGIKVGQRLQVKFSHLPGYDTYTWMRVMSLQVQQDEETDKRYTLSMELTPQSLPVGLVQSAHAGIGLPGSFTVDFVNPPTAGNTLLVFQIQWTGTTGGAPHDPSGNMGSTGGYTWTAVPGTHNIAAGDPTQFPGPGTGATVGAWYRTVHAGESNVGVATCSAEGNISLWVVELAGASTLSATASAVNDNTGGGGGHLNQPYPLSFAGSGLATSMLFVMSGWQTVSYASCFYTITADNAATTFIGRGTNQGNYLDATHTYGSYNGPGMAFAYAAGGGPVALTFLDANNGFNVVGVASVAVVAS